MKPVDIVELAWQRFKARSLRFMLTVLGVGVGIGVVFFLVSLGFGLQEVVIGRIATSESITSLDVVSPEGTSEFVPITNKTVAKFGEVEHVEDVSPVLGLPAEVVYEDLKAQTLSRAVGAEYFSYAGIEVAHGKLFEEDGSYPLVVTSTMLRLFGLSEEESLGKEVKLTFFVPKNPLAKQQEKETAAEEKRAEDEEGEEAEQEEEKDKKAEEQKTEEADENSEPVEVLQIPSKFTIVGVTDNDANVIYVPQDILLGSIETPVYESAKVRVNNTENIEKTRAQLVNKGFSVRALTDTIARLNQIFRITQITLATLGLVALFIASVGMFNTLTISLLERTKEVGILKTIGATRRDVWMIFLFEAIMIGMLGGIAGVTGGILFSKLVNFGINTLAQRFGGAEIDLFAAPLWFVVSIFLISLVVGGLTGLYPAARAARLNPLEAIRHE